MRADGTTLATDGDAAPSAVRGFVALTALTFRRHWRVRALGWVTAGIVGLAAAAVGVFTHGPIGWRLENRPVRVVAIEPPDEQGVVPSVRLTERQYAAERAMRYAALPGPPAHFAVRLATFGAYQAVVLDPAFQQFRDDYAFIRYSRWVVFGLFLTFVLPLFTLAYASGAIGSEREGRTLIWLATRPLPRSAIYLAKLLGVLPWCLAVSLAGFAALCLAGGELGQKAFAAYWPSVVAGSVALAALFHLVGAAFRRPAVVGLVYVFFFETLVANLPGSLKRLSLNYYVKSLMYNEASAAAGLVPPDALDVYAPVSPATAWAVLLLAACGLTVLGMWLFSRQEPREEV